MRAVRVGPGGLYSSSRHLLSQPSPYSQVVTLVAAIYCLLVLRGLPQRRETEKQLACFGDDASVADALQGVA